MGAISFRCVAAVVVGHTLVIEVIEVVYCQNMHERIIYIEIYKCHAIKKIVCHC